MIDTWEDDGGAVVTEQEDVDALTCVIVQLPNAQPRSPKLVDCETLARLNAFVAAYGGTITVLEGDDPEPQPEVPVTTYTPNRPRPLDGLVVGNTSDARWRGVNGTDRIDMMRALEAVSRR